ncbi:2Fe-2S iron-sulfur cluster-binding protein [Mycobacterium helveticum]|jgi:ferredoxin|uniref:2Fe-2S iron-sulfur cluster binding domain-containing protein n=1 Tax=Mycobacterium helveticum TaxID=2592811 RepID=A0A557XW02_9MYCO|nr:2Fe-2S iron-sulfur cluster-binding protein [Mycobacterium helveticum]TVS86191.1 2Fe-2S iron-sulfur cluster binding domain-containing protein [Mycobacterium helveticum]TVS90210.1 2Fe-2S iron-sulfur cluster binding domain-containing protein [Mycobacterium helveticum]
MALLRIEPAGVAVCSLDGEPILTALARSGHTHRFGCRRGGCGVCKVEVVSGAVRYQARVADQVLSPAERAAGVCLSCRAVPEGDVVIRLRAGDRLRCVAPMLAALACKTNKDTDKVKDKEGER